MKTRYILVASIVLQFFLCVSGLYADREYWVLDSGGKYIFKINSHGEELGYFNAPKTFGVNDGYHQYGQDLYMNVDGSASLFLENISDDEVISWYFVVFDSRGSLVFKELLGTSENEISYGNPAYDPENGIMYYTETLESDAVFNVLKKQNGRIETLLTIPLQSGNTYVPYYDINVKTRSVYVVENSKTTLSKYNAQNKQEYTIKSPEGSRIYGFKLDKRDDSVYVSFRNEKQKDKQTFTIVKYDKRGREVFTSKKYTGAYLIDINPQDGSLYFCTVDSWNKSSEKKLIRLSSKGEELFASLLSGDYIECAVLDTKNNTLTTIEDILATQYKKMITYDGKGKKTVNNNGTLSLLSFFVKQMAAVP